MVGCLPLQPLITLFCDMKINAGFIIIGVTYLNIWTIMLKIKQQNVCDLHGETEGLLYRVTNTAVL